MYYKDAGFRALYKNFVAFSLNDKLKPCIENFPAADKANCILTYGYIDRQAGLTMEILAAGIENDGRFSFAGTTTEKRAFIRVGAVIEDEFFLFDDVDGGLSRRYAKKLEMLKHYAASEEIEEIRKMDFLDRFRDKCYPDDVLVFLTRQGLRPEGCWVRITGLGDDCIEGTLLNEPDQNFGHHSGEKIDFFVLQQKDESFILYTDLTPGAN